MKAKSPDYWSGRHFFAFLEMVNFASIFSIKNRIPEDDAISKLAILTGFIVQTAYMTLDDNRIQDDNFMFIRQGGNYHVLKTTGCTTAPQITIQVGSGRLDVQAETISAEAGARVLLDYQQQHPLAARELSRMMGINLVEGTAAELEVAIEKSLPMVALAPRNPE